MHDFALQGLRLQQQGAQTKVIFGPRADDQPALGCRVIVAPRRGPDLDTRRTIFQHIDAIQPRIRVLQAISVGQPEAEARGLVGDEREGESTHRGLTFGDGERGGLERNLATLRLQACESRGFGRIGAHMHGHARALQDLGITITDDAAGELRIGRRFDHHRHRGDVRWHHDQEFGPRLLVLVVTSACPQLHIGGYAAQQGAELAPRCGRERLPATVRPDELDFVRRLAFGAHHDGHIRAARDAHGERLRRVHGHSGTQLHFELGAARPRDLCTVDPRREDAHAFRVRPNDAHRDEEREGEPAQTSACRACIEHGAQIDALGRLFSLLDSGCNQLG